MNTPRLLLTTALLTAALGSSAQAANLCQHANTTTLAKNSYARVFAKGSAAKVCIKSSGVKYKLAGASPTGSVFALGGQFVGFSSPPAYDPTITEPSVVNVVHIPDHKIPRFMPNGTNEHVDAIVVKPNGAAAWAMSGDDGSHSIQGQDREDHAPDDFSDDGTDLRDAPGAAVTWTEGDGTPGTMDLFTEPAEIF